MPVLTYPLDHEQSEPRSFSEVRRHVRRLLTKNIDGKVDDRFATVSPRPVPPLLVRIVERNSSHDATDDGLVASNYIRGAYENCFNGIVQSIRFRAPFSIGLRDPPASGGFQPGVAS